ncbi:MAG: hypothetical protein CMJ32_04230 [Phycisphaerae bacterium]|nr:hypothetical protein [Phycisphaerae bacterium]
MTTDQTGNRYSAAIILAAGKGTRMKSDLPKVMHEAAGRPIVDWVVAAARASGIEKIVLVIGHGAELVREFYKDDDDIHWAVQEEQLGTGHAVMSAAGVFDADREGDILILCGDAPLIRSSTLQTLLLKHHQDKAALTMATSILDDPSGYGRIIRDANGRLDSIVEDRDADPQQKAIREINPGYYCFDGRTLFKSLPLIENDNAKGEYYLTDLVGIYREQGRIIDAVDALEPEDVLAVNDREQLQQVDSILRARNGEQLHAEKTA